MDESLLRVVVRETVEETLTRLGFTIDNPIEIQADMQYLRKSREGGEEVAKWIKRSAIGVCVTAACFACWEGLKKLIVD